jgi:CRP-like cAMP-binding protein
MKNIELLKSFSFFDTFTNDEAELVLPFVSIKSYRKDEVVIGENELNFDLYFLIEGSVDIQVENQVVSSLENSGEVLGEMSIASHSLSTATVISRKPTSFMVVSFEQLKSSLPSGKSDAVLKKFYQSTAESLANKLIQNNATAKTFKKQPS